MANVLAATVTSTSWDNATGILTIELKRPDETVPGIKLSEVITASILVSPETPSRAANARSCGSRSSARASSTRRPAPKLEFLSSDEEGAEPEGGDSVVEAVAAALKGQIWDTENEDWQ